MPKSKSSAKGFQDHDLAGMNPLVAQERFKPTDATPIRMHAQMAGDPVPEENFIRSAAEKKVDAMYGKNAPAKAPEKTKTYEAIGQKQAKKLDDAERKALGNE